MEKLIFFCAVILWSIMVTSTVSAQIRPLKIVEKSFFAFDNARLAQRASSISFSSTTQLCMDNGGVPANLAEALDGILLTNALAPWNYPTTFIFFAGANARPSSATANSCPEFSTTSWTSTSCSYRFRFGFYDEFTSFGEPGTAFFRGLYAQTSMKRDQYVNGYYYPVWSNNVGTTSYPHGYYQVLGSRQNRAWLAIDGPAVAEANNPAPLTSYVAICETQKYVQGTVFRSTEMPQPTVVPSWKELTWAQKNWWVIFLIVAIIILVLLIAIIVFCYCTSIEEKPGPPINSLVLRERVGKPYIIGSKTPAEYPMQEMKYESGLTLEPGQEPLRQGRGFNFNPLVYNDPEEMAQNVPVVYNTDGDTMIYSDGDSVSQNR